jgi:hypothetical protein
MSDGIHKPIEGQFIDHCHYSFTGWAIWEGHPGWASCTCKPASRPSKVYQESILAAADEYWRAGAA